jgi:hypothetical protein
MEAQYILNTPLPITQDFKSLKEDALGFIQEYGGWEWTNLNASDPGVTILDQVCYALTELGYCNDFPISDILTASNGKLHLKNQFYLPEQILTTSPVTFHDYRKYLIDGVSRLKNAMLYAKSNTFYETYLLPKNEVGHATHQEIEQEAFYYLNKCRNINELFLVPKTLQVVTITLFGNVAINNQNELDNILIAINSAIENDIFPAVKQHGYESLQEQGLNTNDIFNGPLLKNGWIDANTLGKHKKGISIHELNNLIAAVPGVESVSGLRFTTDELHVQLDVSDILTIDISGLNITYKKSTQIVELKSILRKTKAAEMNVVLGAAVKIQTELPKGKYRDIHSYYSIQNTFPEIFAVGKAALTSNAKKFQIAQSRQLKGYLTLFDQVLANQFAQLANVDKLFSFKNSMSASPTDLKEFYAVKTDFEKKNNPYPVPYLNFSPTYYYQSLYKVPHIKPLLKDHDALKLMAIDQTTDELDTETWMAYKQNPYNPYMHGLMKYMTDEKIDSNRRNNILDHLLARHGESPLVIDAILDGTVYTGNKLSDQVIVKSLYLQNLGLLSYYRHKAYNYLAANVIKALNTEIPIPLNQAFFEDDSKDFIFKAEKVERIEKLSDSDFISYAAIELKMSLLFGLKMQYKNYLINYADLPNTTDELELQVVSWMIKNRKGLIFIETNLLWQCLDFQLLLATNVSIWEVERVNFEQLMEIQFFINQGNSIVIQEDNTFVVGNNTYPVIQKVIPVHGNENSIIEINIISDAANPITVPQDLIFENKALLIFPKFLESNAFINRLDIFLQQDLPVATTYQHHFEDSIWLESFINTFVDWHNCLLYQKDISDVAENLKHTAFRLAKSLLNLNQKSDELN